MSHSSSFIRTCCSAQRAATAKPRFRPTPIHNLAWPPSSSLLQFRGVLSSSTLSRSASSSAPRPSRPFSTSFRSQLPPSPSARSATSSSSHPSATGPTIFQARQEAARNAYYKQRNKSLLLYTAAVLVLGVGVTYAAVPLYRMFCAQTGYGGVPLTSGRDYVPGTSTDRIGRFAPEKLIPFLGGEGKKERKIKVTFNADCSDALPWKFSPLQKEVRVRPGESALAFYTATNKSDKDIIGIATYNVTPNNIAPYFAKVECFCFEEQRLLAGEEVDLPILFFIDRDFVDDPSMRDVQDVVLSYTFFKAKRDSYGNLVPDNSSG